MTDAPALSPEAEVLLAHINLAMCHLKLDQFHLVEAATYLRGGQISPEGALYLLWQNDVLELISPLTQGSEEAA